MDNVYLSGLWDDITSAVSAVKSNIENVVIPYWSSEAKSAISATVTKISDLTGWLAQADSNIAKGKAIYDQLVASGQATAQDKALTENITQKEIDLANRLQKIGTDIQNGSQSGSDYTVQISSNPAEASSSNTFNVTTSLLPSTYMQGLGILPEIAIAVAGVSITGVVVYEIYKLKNDADQYYTYMQARAEAIKKGAPLPPLPPALAQYTATNKWAWALGGIVVAIGVGTFVYIKYFKDKKGYVTNPFYSDKQRRYIYWAESKGLVPKGTAYRMAHDKRRRGRKIKVVHNPSTQQDILLSQGIEMFKQFHGFEPTKIKKVKVPDSYPPVLVDIGKASEVLYKSNKWDRKQRYYIHDLENKSNWATDTEGRGLFLVNEKLKVKNVGITG